MRFAFRNIFSGSYIRVGFFEAGRLSDKLSLYRLATQDMGRAHKFTPLFVPKSVIHDYIEKVSVYVLQVILSFLFSI